MAIFFSFRSRRMNVGHVAMGPEAGAAHRAFAWRRSPVPARNPDCWCYIRFVVTPEVKLRSLAFFLNDLLLFTLHLSGKCGKRESFIST
jgi:hypothetical protein